MVIIRALCSSILYNYLCRDQAKPFFLIKGFLLVSIFFAFLMKKSLCDLLVLAEEDRGELISLFCFCLFFLVVFLYESMIIPWKFQWMFEV